MRSGTRTPEKLSRKKVPADPARNGKNGFGRGGSADGNPFSLDFSLRPIPSSEPVAKENRPQNIFGQNFLEHKKTGAKNF
jgi:hypothetical protein